MAHRKKRKPWSVGGVAGRGCFVAALVGVHRLRCGMATARLRQSCRREHRRHRLDGSLTRRDAVSWLGEIEGRPRAREQCPQGGCLRDDRLCVVVFDHFVRACAQCLVRLGLGGSACRFGAGAANRSRRFGGVARGFPKSESDHSRVRWILFINPFLQNKMVKKLIACQECKRQWDVSRYRVGQTLRCVCNFVMEVPRRRSYTPEVAHCQNCGASRSADQTPCHYCGAVPTMDSVKLSLVCPLCLRRTPKKSKFCASCGKPLNLNRPGFPGDSNS